MCISQWSCSYYALIYWNAKNYNNWININNFQSTEGKQETPVHKGKGTKRPLERKEETPVKHFVEPVVRNEEPTMHRKKGKSKATEKPNEVDETLPMQKEEESEENPIKTKHATIPPDSQTYKSLIK